MGRWVMSVQYEFDQFRKWNFWNGGQKTEKALKNAIVLTLIKKISLLHKMVWKPQKWIPHPWKCALRPQDHLDGSKKAEFGVPSQIQIFSKMDVFSFLAFFYQFWLWSTVESTWMVNLTSYVSSGIHINAKQTPGSPNKTGYSAFLAYFPTLFDAGDMVNLLHVSQYHRYELWGTNISHMDSR